MTPKVKKRTYGGVTRVDKTEFGKTQERERLKKKKKKNKMMELYERIYISKLSQKLERNDPDM